MDYQTISLGMRGDLNFMDKIFMQRRLSVIRFMFLFFLVDHLERDFMFKADLPKSLNGTLCQNFVNATLPK